MTLVAPEKAVAGSVVSVGWKIIVDDGNFAVTEFDQISVGKAGDRSHYHYQYCQNGSNPTFSSPQRLEPMKSATAQDPESLSLPVFSVSLIVTPAEVDFHQAPSEAVAGSTIQVGWTTNITNTHRV